MSSLRLRIVSILAFTLFLFGTLSAFFSYHIYLDASFEAHKQLSVGVSKLAASLIDAERVAEFLEKGEAADGYIETRNKLLDIKHSLPDIKYIYVYKIMPDGCHVVFDLDEEDKKGDSPGTVIKFDDAFSSYIPALLAGQEIDPVVSDETFGWLLTAYSPVRDADGVCHCYAAADISMNWIREQARNYLLKISALLFFIFLLFLAFITWYFGWRIIRPLNTIADATSIFAYTSDDSMEKSLDWIRRLDIHTGDEIENLYRAFTKMAGDSVKHITDIRIRNEAISKMHYALILVLADMVESRDKNTGQHIRKTASYARIIMEELKREGVYAEELTSSFIENVVNSAPLHDIGKINVPDAILNKPGKLSDEEFDLMKSHAATGGAIIKRIIDMMPDSEYLQEAYNLATFHHERWNGHGYPSGISGHDIPLSARIMAVADVFDALVSNRSYKKGFSYEKAFAIIREESGTHFDPKIVDAFFAARERVLHIAKSFRKQ